MSTYRFSRIVVCASLLFTALAGALQAQSSGTQTFTVVVPQSISITAPTAASLTHDESNNTLAFAPQAWVVRGNARNGVNVSFATATAFVNTSDSTFKRDAKLELGLGTTQGPATWAIGTASDTTDYTGGDQVAQVTASSNGVGRANLNLTVSFITGEYGVFAAGDYVTTVTGTVTAK